MLPSVAARRCAAFGATAQTSVFVLVGAKRQRDTDIAPPRAGQANGINAPSSPLRVLPLQRAAFFDANERADFPSMRVVPWSKLRESERYASSLVPIIKNGAADGVFLLPESNNI